MEENTLVQIVLNSLPSPHSKRAYERGRQNFLAYWQEKGKPELDKAFLVFYVSHLQAADIGESSINQRLSAMRKLAREAADCDIWPDAVAAAFASVKNIARRGHRSGNWLSIEQTQLLISTPDCNSPVGMRDRALLAVALGCGLRRSELTTLTIEHIQRIEGRWAIVNLLGKRNKLRTVTIPAWTKQALDAYLDMVEGKSGRLFRAMSKSGRILKDQLSPETIRDIVEKYADICGFDFAPHDLRRTYAKLSYKNGARLDQIQINLGHASLTTTQRYLGNELDLTDSPGDYIDISIT